MISFCYLWFRDLIIESYVFGKYNRKLRSAIAAGFVLFLGSECLLFGGFFWMYLDRIFHSPAVYGGTSIPLGVEILVWYKKPLYVTLVLLMSSLGINGANYNMKWGSWTIAVVYSLSGILLGCLFLVLQVSEYIHLSFSMSDTVYGSGFLSINWFSWISCNNRISFFKCTT